ncbi:hypothetical protein GEI7407_0898 [Geitlerinema sp. PCC 7407]|nr:hypothetical protein GEI7407_0898 [Geitlerinema sp. PCC 7407]
MQMSPTIRWIIRLIAMQVVILSVGSGLLVWFARVAW